MPLRVDNDRKPKDNEVQAACDRIGPNFRAELIKELENMAGVRGDRWRKRLRLGLLGLIAVALVVATLKALKVIS